MVGDFNAVKNKNERRGMNSFFDSTKASAFQFFIDELDLIDLPVVGKSYTWFRVDGSTMSRLDRFLVSEGWLNEWKHEVQCIGLRDVSDYCPIMLRGENLNWGPKPFRFNNCWLQHGSFKSFVRSSWDSFQCCRWKIYQFTDKLRSMKGCLRR